MKEMCKTRLAGILGKNECIASPIFLFLDAEYNWDKPKAYYIRSTEGQAPVTAASLSAFLTDCTLIVTAKFNASTNTFLIKVN